MYVVTVEFEIHHEHVDAFRAEMLAQATNSLTREVGCRQFDVCFDGDPPVHCYLYEKYDDRTAFDEHLTSEHFKSFAATVEPWIVSKAVRTWQQIN
jgi:quinol monooxygenase YgiN